MLQMLFLPVSQKLLYFHFYPYRQIRKRKLDTMEQPTTPENSSRQQRQLRPRKKTIDYSEEEPDPDEFIFCDECEEEFIDGECPYHHVVLWLDVKGILQVAKSTIEGAGDGVFSILKTDVIPVGVMFGPYRGKFIKKSAYKIESVYGCELSD